jgi:hypothetical protein
MISWRNTSRVRARRARRKNADSRAPTVYPIPRHSGQLSSAGWASGASAHSTPLGNVGSAGPKMHLKRGLFAWPRGSSSRSILKYDHAHSQLVAAPLARMFLSHSTPTGCRVPSVSVARSSPCWQCCYHRGRFRWATPPGFVEFNSNGEVQYDDPVAACWHDRFGFLGPRASAKVRRPRPGAAESVEPAGRMPVSRQQPVSSHRFQRGPYRE